MLSVFQGVTVSKSDLFIVLLNLQHGDWLCERESCVQFVRCVWLGGCLLQLPAVIITPCFCRLRAPCSPAATMTADSSDTADRPPGQVPSAVRRVLTPSAVRSVTATQSRHSCWCRLTPSWHRPVRSVTATQSRHSCWCRLAAATALAIKCLTCCEF